MLPFLDINVWLPLVWEAHVANRAATLWVESQEKDLCLCRVTQLALLRHLCNPSIMGEDVLTNQEAGDVVSGLVATPGVRICADPNELDTVFPSIGKSGRPERNRWTDAYLAAFAISGQYQLVTFDRGFERYESLGLHWHLLQV
jgi:toxin-antitoxin system PIN domain toxin